MELVSKGNGMIAGLEIWRSKGKFVLVDVSSDGRFASDVGVWMTACGPVGLNTKTIKKRKDAKKQDTATPCSTNTHS